MSGNDKLKAFVAGTAAVGLYYFCKKLMINQRVSKKIRSKRKQCKESFDKVKQSLLSANLSGEEVMRIVDLSFTELHSQLQDGTLKAVHVLHAYQTYALNVNDRLNCITEPILEAEEIAQALDEQSGEKGPLHGIPVSLKEAFDLIGYDSTAGMGCLLGDVKRSEAVLVKVLKGLGAVPFVKTNIPQTMMTYECSNPIFGATHNPFDITRTPGGSTGGEAALIGARGSVVGLGSDVGGSIRVPAHFCGCYGLKTTTERFSRTGFTSLSKGQMQVTGTLGPMTRDFPALVTVTKAMLSDLHFQLDPAVPPIKFRDEIYDSKVPLKIGFYVNDGYIKAIPSCARAVLRAKEALELLGHTVVPFTPPRVRYMFPFLYIKSVQGDQGKQYTSKLSQDIVDPTIKRIARGLQNPKWLSWVLSWVVQAATRDKVFGDAIRSKLSVGSVYDWFQHAIKIQEYKAEFLEAWQSQELDAVICPPFATTAVKAGQVERLLGAGSYSMLYNVLNYPAGSIPVTKVTRDDVINMDKWPSNTLSEKTIKKSSVGSEGLPVNVMCASLPFHEEQVLRVMRDIHQGLETLKK